MPERIGSHYFTHASRNRRDSEIDDNRVTTLFVKDNMKENHSGNYRPPIFPSLIWKRLTGIIANKLYEHLEVKKEMSRNAAELPQGAHGTHNTGQGNIQSFKKQENKHSIMILCLTLWILDNHEADKNGGECRTADSKQYGSSKHRTQVVGRASDKSGDSKRYFNAICDHRSSS